MNAVEIEEAVTELVENPFDAAEFPYQFLGRPAGRGGVVSERIPKIEE